MNHASVSRENKANFPSPKARLGVGRAVARSGEVCTRLGGEKVTDNGLIQLSKMDKLNQLILTGNFTDDALLYLERLPTISILDILEGVNFSPEAMQRFRRNMPELVIFQPNMRAAMQQPAQRRPTPAPMK